MKPESKQEATKVEATTAAKTKKKRTHKAKVETAKTTITKKGTKTKKAILDKKNAKTTVKQVVKSQREIKYKYPEDIDNQLDRKAWRQKVRGKDKQFKLKIAKMKESNNPSLSKLEATYKKFRTAHYLVA